MKRTNKTTRRKQSAFDLEIWLGDHLMLTILLIILLSMIYGGIISYNLTAKHYEGELDKASTQYRKVWDERNRYYDAYVEMVNNTGNGG